MNLEELRSALHERQVELWVEGRLLRFRTREQALDETLLAALRRHKKALIEALRRETPDTGRNGQLEPLSMGQEALYFLHALAPQSAAYNVAAAMRVHSPVNAAAMRQLFGVLTSRHESLRTTFTIVDGQPRRRVHAQGALDFEQVPAAGWDEARLRDAVSQEYRRPFDLSAGPLMRVRLFTRAESDHVFLLALHHIIFDAWSLWILQDEIQLLYRQYTGGETALLPALSASYADFVRGQNELQSSERGERLWAYWRDRLAGDPAPPDLPLDYCRPERPSMEGASHHFRIPQELATGLRTLAKAHGATPFMVMLAIFKTLLHRYTGQDDLIVGTATSGRSQPAFARLVGYFVNTLAIRTSLARDMTFADYLAQVKQRTLEAIEHQDYPFPRLVDRLNPRRDSGRLPICSVMFGLQKPQQQHDVVRLFDEDAGYTDWGGLDVQPFQLDQQEGQFDLTLEMFAANESFLGTLKYDTELLTAATAERMGRHFQQLAAAIVRDPNRRLAEYDILADAERRQIVALTGTESVPLPCDRRAHRLFEEQVARSPNRTAAVFGDESLTYDALNRRANRMARLLQTLGICPGDVVACRTKRGVDTATVLLAIAKAGGTYVPLDTTSPRHRLDGMLADCHAKVLLTHAGVHDTGKTSAAAANCSHCAPVVYLDKVAETLAGLASTNLELDFSPRTCAYIIYTSGSTGQPKGVRVSHAALVEHLVSIRQVYRLVAEDRVLQFSNTTFDPSLEQMLASWSVGATVVFRGEELWSSRQFWARVQEHALTVINLPPAYLRQCAETLEANTGDVSTLRLVISGGDLFPAETLPLWRAHGVRILNAYGPTEAVITATTYDASNHGPGRARVPIGRPVPGVRAYVLDELGNLAPVGVPGELCLGGPMLADGYQNDRQLTAHKFVPDPFAGDDGARMYRTGDSARWNADGELEYLGRRDRQVKIHGFRVELGEIETVLDSCGNVRQATVQSRKDAHGDDYLVAWLSTDEQNRPAADAIRAYLRSRLPGYMIPRQFVFLDQMPVNSAGKVDTAALPEPTLARPASREYVGPRGPVERSLADIWSRVLDVETVGVHDNFFELGGSSLTSLRIIALARDAGLRMNGEQMKPELLFEYPTIAELAALCTGKGA